MADMTEEEFFRKILEQQAPQRTEEEFFQQILDSQRQQQATHQAAPEPTPSRVGGAFNAFTDSAAFGFGDELEGLEAGLLGKTPEGDWFNYEQPFDVRRDAARDAFRAKSQEFAANNPTTDAMSRIGGALAMGGGLASSGATLMRGGGTAINAMGRGAAEGAIYGAAHGAGAADGEDVAGEAAMGALMGANIGGVAAGGMQAISNALARSAARRATPSLQDLRRSADAAYSTARAQNPSFPRYAQLAQQARQAMQAQGFHQRLHPKVSVALDEIERLAQSGKTPTLQDVEQVRRITKAAAGSIEPDERRLASMLIDGVDNFVETTAPTTTIAEGRRLYGQMKRGERIEQLVEAAQRRAASTGTGGNEINAVRQNLRRILDNPKLRRGYSQQELQAIEDIVMGTPSQNALRLLGRLSPTSGALPLMANLGAAAINPVALGIGGAGAVAKALAERSAQGAVGRLGAMVRSGHPMPKTAPLISGPRAALVRALSAHGGANNEPAMEILRKGPY